VAAGREPVYQSYVVLLPGAAASARDAVVQQLKALGVEASIGTWNIPMTRYYREKYGYKAGDFPVADSTAARSLTLPMFQGISAAQQDQVAAALRRVLNDLGICHSTDRG
jgi:perosamine synthetase